MKSLSPTLVATALLAQAANSANITFCADSQCELPTLGDITLDPSSGCQTAFASQALAANWFIGDDNATSNQEMRFYRSADCFTTCGSNHLIHGTQGARGFVSWGHREGPVMQSFEVVELDEGQAPGYGYCGVRHGEARSVNGRTVKFQQIAKGWFVDVPVEAWDKGVHEAVGTKAVGMSEVRHGWVMQYGHGELWKVHKMARDMWSYVLLEEWDHDKHVESDEPFAKNTDFYNEDGGEADSEVFLAWADDKVTETRTRTREVRFVLRN